MKIYKEEQNIFISIISMTCFNGKFVIIGYYITNQILNLIFL